MRAEIICSSREVFGSDRSAIRLGALLRDLGVGVTLVVPARRPERGLRELAIEEGLDFVTERVTVLSSAGVHDPAAALARRDRSVDLTILNTTAVVTRGKRCARILVVREWLDPSSLRHRVLAAWQHRNLSAVVGISRGVLAQWCAIQGPRTRQFLVPNWLENDLLGSGERRTAADGNAIVCIGRFNAWKGQHVLADAYDAAFGAGRGPRLTFVGVEDDADDSRSRALALTQRTDRNWRFVTRTSDPWRAVGNATLLVVPSLRPEPFGNVILEALVRGCRVITFPGGGPTDLAEAFPDVVTLAPRSVTGLATALRAWDDAGRRAQTDGEYARSVDTLRREYSAAAARRRWGSVLEAVA